MAGVFDDASEVLLDEVAEDSFVEEVSLLPEPEPESDEDVESDDELAFEESVEESLDCFFAPLVSARESLQ